MSEISEEEWKRDLTSILEDLSSAQYIKMKECLRGFPRVLKDGQSREEMPGQIIEFYGKEKSILEIERVMEQIPKRNDLVQSLLKPYVQKVRSKQEKQQHEMKRRREEEPEEGTSPAAEKKLARLRTALVENMSRELINQLLDDLLMDGVLNDGEKDSVLQENDTRADRARCLIDMVKRKGCEASKKIICHIQSRDPTLSADLGLPV